MKVPTLFELCCSIYASYSKINSNPKSRKSLRNILLSLRGGFDKDNTKKTGRIEFKIDTNGIDKKNSRDN